MSLLDNNLDIDLTISNSYATGTVTNTSIPADMFGIEGSNCYVQQSSI